MVGVALMSIEMLSCCCVVRGPRRRTRDSTLLEFGQPYPKNGRSYPKNGQSPVLNHICPDGRVSNVYLSWEREGAGVSFLPRCDGGTASFLRFVDFADALSGLPPVLPIIDVFENWEQQRQLRFS